MFTKRLLLFVVALFILSCSSDKNEPECINYTDCPQGFDCIDGFCVEEGKTQSDDNQQTMDNSQSLDDSSTLDETADESQDDLVDEVVDVGSDEATDEMQDEGNDEISDEIIDELQDEAADSTPDEIPDHTVDETVDNEVPDDYVPICGNGIVDSGEDCDDGKKDNGDGCDLDCNLETGFKCSGNPSICAKVFVNGVNLLTESAMDIPVCSYVKVIFSQAMDDTSASSNVFLEKSGMKIALKKIETSGDNKEYTYYPSFDSGSVIDVDVNYNIVVGKDVEAQSGDKTSADLFYSFSASANDVYLETFEKAYSPWELETIWEIGTPNYPYDMDNYPADREITVGYDGSDNTLGTIMDGFYSSSVDGEQARPTHPIFIPFSGASMTFYAHVDTEQGTSDWYDGMSILVYECTSSGCFDSPVADVSVLENSDTSSDMTISGYTDFIGDYYITNTSNQHYGIRGKEQTDNTYRQFTVHFPGYFAGKWIIPAFRFYSDGAYNHPGIYVDNISIGY